jgi:hypothetical protein
LLQTCFLFSFLFSAFLFTQPSARAASVTLSWDANSAVSGASYKVYYGSASGVYTNAVWVASPNVTISGLNSNGLYYFAATTFDSAGHESGYSGEINYAFVAGQPVQLVSINNAGINIRHQFNFAPQGVSGLQYIVQASSNLIDWISLQTNIAPFTFVDTNSSQYKQRFYRTILAQ